jgi:hypothetical protein
MKDLTERQYWDRLEALSAANNVIGFYREYAAYLESRNVISSGRKSIHKMALEVIKKLEWHKEAFEIIHKYNEESDEDEQ